jgi:hypothetical protein
MTHLKSGAVNIQNNDGKIYFIMFLQNKILFYRFAHVHLPAVPLHFSPPSSTRLPHFQGTKVTTFFTQDRPPILTFKVQR